MSGPVGPPTSSRAKRTGPSLIQIDAFEEGPCPAVDRWRAAGLRSLTPRACGKRLALRRAELELVARDAGKPRIQSLG